MIQPCRLVRRTASALALACAVGAAPPARAQPPTPAAAARARLESAAKAGQFQAALQAYDQYVKAARPDMTLLAPIATGMLHAEVAQHRDAPVAAVPALERLARSGDAPSLDQLKALAKQAQGFSAIDLAPLLALSRLGDSAVQAQLAARLDAAASTDRVAMIQALERGRATAAGERVAAYLRDPEAGIRAAAAAAVGALGYAKAAPVLEQMLRDDVGAVKLFAAVGLARLGQHGGDAYLASMLQTPAPEMRVIVASAYDNAKSGGPWLAQVKELLKDPDPAARVRAARIVACCDPPAARAVLVGAVSAANPGLRAEAAAALEESHLIDAPLARTLLGNPAPAVYVPAAGAVLTPPPAQR